MRDESHVSKKHVDFSEGGLAAVERYERHFGLNDDGAPQQPARSLEHVQLAALDVDLETIHALDFFNVVETARGNPAFALDNAENLKVIEKR